MERVEDELFIANGNVIYYWNGTSSGTAFTLPDGQAVTSLRRHPDGRTLLAFTSGDRELNYSHTKSASGNVYYLNPTLRGFDREVVLTAQVEGTRNLGGVIFCTWGNNIGYFDGNALRFLRKIEDSSYIYSQGLKAIEDILIYIDGQNVIGYGDLGAGNVFFPMFTQGTYDLTHLAYQGGNRLLVSHSDGAGGGVLAVIDYDNTGAYGTFYSNKIDFGDQAVISKIVLLHDTTATGGTTNIRIFERDLNGTLNTIERVAHSGVSNNRTEVHCGGLKRDIFQLVLQPEDDDIGYRSIQIHYDRIR